MLQKLKYVLRHSYALLLLTPATAFASGPGDFFGLNAIKQLFCTGSGPACAGTFSELALGVIQLLLFVSGSLAVLFLIIGGYFYITSGGNEEQAARGRKTITNAIIGLIIIILSYTIVNVIISTLGGRV